jgi:hypothetical protein
LNDIDDGYDSDDEQDMAELSTKLGKKVGAWVKPLPDFILCLMFCLYLFHAFRRKFYQPEFKNPIGEPAASKQQEHFPRCDWRGLRPKSEY